METLSAEKLRNFQTPQGSLTIWWLGQAGFVFKSPGGKIVVIDPYLTNSVRALGEQHGFNMDRLVPAPISPADLGAVDLYAMTHSHGDHLDPETVAGYRAAGGTGPYLAPAETVEKLQQFPARRRKHQQALKALHERERHDDISPAGSGRFGS